jgi:hypothetical protein
MTFGAAIRRFRPWRGIALIAALAVFTLTGSGVFAYWSAGSGAGGSGVAAATSVGSGSTPTAIPAGTTVTVSWTASTLANGTAVSGYVVKRYNATTLALQTIGSACSGTLTALSCTETSVPSGQWKYTVTPTFATNWSGAESPMSSVTYTDPTAPTNLITLNPVSGSAMLSGSTVYYNGAVAGSFTLTNAVADAGSGPASSSTAALGGTSTGWTTTPSTVSTPTGGPYQSSVFSWAAGTTSSPTEVVTGGDRANNTVTTTLTFVNDSTAPAGSISYTNGYQVGKYVTVTFSGSDGGSGIATAVLQRSSASFVNGACSTFSGFATLATSPTSPYTDSAVVNAQCYVYRYVQTDRLGNSSTATSGNVAWVDYAGAVRFQTAGILSQWRLGDPLLTGGTVAVDSVGGNTGAYVNGVTQGTNGDLVNDNNTSATFDGTNDYMQATSPSGLPVGAAARSVELWFKTTRTTQQTLFTYGSRAGTGEFGLILNSGATSVTAWGGDAATNPVFTLPSAVSDGKWHYIVETYSGTAVDVFIDGTALAVQTAARATVVDAYGFQLGAVVVPGDANSGFYFGGTFDEVAVYTRALSQTDVTNHYQLGFNPNSDNSGPVGGFAVASGLTGTGNAYSTSTTLHLSGSKGTDPDGIASTGFLAFEATAPLTSTGNADGVCGTFSAFVLVATDPPTAGDLTVPDHECYVFAYSVPDTLGNYTTYSTGIIKVDSTLPPVPTFAFSALTNTWPTGSILYYNPTKATGSFTVTATSTDTVSGITGYVFPIFGTNWTSTAPTVSSRTYSWALTPTGSGAQVVTVTNNASTTSSGSFTVTPDQTAPTGATITYVNGKPSGVSVPITYSSGTDAGSGVVTTLISRRSSTLTGGTGGTCAAFPGTYTALVTNPAASYTDGTVVVGNCYQYEITVTDGVGNSATVTSTNVAKVS